MVSEVTDPAGKPTVVAAPQASTEQVISPRTAQELRSAMRTVVNRAAVRRPACPGRSVSGHAIPHGTPLAPRNSPPCRGPGPVSRLRPQGEWVRRPRVRT
ncbi:hypothetical protein [Streptomyces sp. H27-H1]|uniref:hypothetical protein n=1 Tax=Streptomyces sp. H27-H1 TaxID=2996461 RepID=UPI003B6341FF